MLKGTVEVLEDAPTKELIWLEGDTQYYVGGDLFPPIYFISIILLCLPPANILRLFLER
jgi:general stress protein 26